MINCEQTTDRALFPALSHLLSLVALFATYHSVALFVSECCTICHISECCLWKKFIAFSLSVLQQLPDQQLLLRRMHEDCNNVVKRAPAQPAWAQHPFQETASTGGEGGSPGLLHLILSFPFDGLNVAHFCALRVSGKFRPTIGQQLDITLKLHSHLCKT